MMENLSVPALEYASKALVDGAISLGKVSVIHFESMGPSTKKHENDRKHWKEQKQAYEDLLDKVNN